jgi:hypothetical protein
VIEGKMESSGKEEVIALMNLIIKNLGEDVNSFQNTRVVEQLVNSGELIREG